MFVISLGKRRIVSLEGRYPRKGLVPGSGSSGTPVLGVLNKGASPGGFRTCFVCVGGHFIIDTDGHESHHFSQRPPNRFGHLCLLV